MKHTFFALCCLVLFGACSKWKSQQKQITQISTDGTWYISSYTDNGENETAEFSTFRLNFLEDGVLNGTDLLSSSSTPFSGTWSITDSNTNDDSLEDLDYNINFNVGNKLDDLSDDWDIISFSETEIKLKDVSGGGGGTDYLTLTKLP